MCNNDLLKKVIFLKKNKFYFGICLADQNIKILEIK